MPAAKSMAIQVGVEYSGRSVSAPRRISPNFVTVSARQNTSMSVTDSMTNQPRLTKY